VFTQRPNTWARAAVVASIYCLSQSAAIGAPDDDAAYHALVQRVKAGDMTVDFRELRLDCIKASDCNPRGMKTDLAAMSLARQSGVLGTAVETAEKIVQDGFVNIDAHVALAEVYAALNEPAKAKFHFDVAIALTHSIFISGDGKTKETAFEVICDREEYFVMTALGLPYLGYSNLVVRFEDGPHKYEKRQVKDPNTLKQIRDPKTGKDVVVFFNIDAFSRTRSRASDTNQIGYPVTELDVRERD
jgi:hypothetical protein